jgi:hypothetical protein
MIDLAEEWAAAAKDRPIRPLLPPDPEFRPR